MAEAMELNFFANKAVNEYIYMQHVDSLYSFFGHNKSFIDELFFRMPKCQLTLYSNPPQTTMLRNY